jgi:hypothetical protein
VNLLIPGKNLTSIGAPCSQYFENIAIALRKTTNEYLPAYVTKEFDEYLKCGRLEHGFLRVRCAKSRHLQVRLAMMKNWLLLVVRDEAFA